MLLTRLQGNVPAR